MLTKTRLPDSITQVGTEKSIILTPIHGEPNLHMKDGVLVFSGNHLEDLGEALVKLREERLKTIRKTNEKIISLP